MHGGLKSRDGKGCTAHHAGPTQKMQRALAIRWHRTLSGEGRSLRAREARATPGSCGESEPDWVP